MPESIKLELGDTLDPLERAVTLIDQMFRDGGWYQPNYILSLEEAEDPNAYWVAVAADHRHPSTMLLGLVAPPTCAALCAVGFGWCFRAPADGTGRVILDGPPSEHPDRQRCRTIMLVDRSGEKRGMLALEDGDVVDEPSEGVVSDTLHRCFRLPTPPPPTSPTELFACRWLGAILGTDEDHPGQRSCDELPTRHPAFPSEQTRTLTWEQFRTRVASGALVDPAVSAEVAAWMDDGSFARWLLHQERPLDDILRALEPRLPAAALHDIQHALTALRVCP